MFNPSEQVMPDFLEELQQTAEKISRDYAQSLIENLIYSEMPPLLKKSINQGYLANVTYDQIIKHIKCQMDLNGIERSDELMICR